MASDHNNSLINRHRPNSLDTVKGNADIVESLTNITADKKKCPHAFLFAGPTGCGKTTFARILAWLVGCKGADYNEIDSAQDRGINFVREIRHRSMMRPIEGDALVFVIDECHKITNDAQNALLKNLEDAPGHVFYILCTTDPNKLIPTLKGRCVVYTVATLTDTQMMGLLRKVVRDEGAVLDKEVMERIIHDSMGHPRNALSILDRVLSVPEDRRMEVARQASAEENQSIDLARILLSKERWPKAAAVLNGMKTAGVDPEEIRRVVLGYCQAVLLKGENDRAAAVIEAFWEPTYNIGFPGIVYAAYSIIAK